MSTTSPRLGFASGRRPLARLRRAGRLLAEPAFFCRADRLGLRLIAGRALRAFLRRRRAVVERQHDLADLDPLALLDPHFLDRAAHRRGHLDGRLVGLELEDRLIFLRRCRRPTPARARRRRRRCSRPVLEV